MATSKLPSQPVVPSRGTLLTRETVNSWPESDTSRFGDLSCGLTSLAKPNVAVQDGVGSIFAGEKLFIAYSSSKVQPFSDSLQTAVIV